MDKEIRNTGENFQETEFLKLKKPADDRIVLIEDLNENSDKIDKFCKDMENNKQNKNDTSLLTKIKTIVGAINELFNNKLEKGNYTGNAKNLNDEISKKASKTVLGRIIVGDNLIIDETGKLSGNPAVDISGKLDKGNVAEKYNTAEKIGIELEKKQNSSDSGLKTNAKTVVGAINENYEKFLNFCPFPINSLYISLDNSNPATLWLGTTWEKQEGKFLLGSSSAYAIGSIGGSATITLTEANMPRHRHKVDTVSATIPEHVHGTAGTPAASYGTTAVKQEDFGGGHSSQGHDSYNRNTKSAGGGSTGAIAPYTSYVGSGTAFNNMPPYLVINIWKRLS